MGMIPSYEVTELVNSKRAKEIHSAYDVSESYILNKEKGVEIIKYSKLPSIYKCKLSGMNYSNILLRAD